MAKKDTSFYQSTNIEPTPEKEQSNISEFMEDESAHVLTDATDSADAVNAGECAESEAVETEEPDAEAVETEASEVEAEAAESDADAVNEAAESDADAVNEAAEPDADAANEAEESEEEAEVESEEEPEESEDASGELDTDEGEVSEQTSDDEAASAITETAEDSFALDAEDKDTAADIPATAEINATIPAAGALTASAASSASKSASSGKHAKHAQAPKEKPRKKSRKERLAEIPEYKRRSRRTRNILILVLLVILILLGALIYLGYQLLETSRTIVSQQSSQTSEVTEVSQNDEATKDASSSTTKSTEAPNLVRFIGKTQDEVVKLLGPGATVSQSQSVNEEDNPIKTRSTVVLTDEVADVKSGTPSVYLGLDADGYVIMAGYSAATSLLGYGSYSFSEAITNQHIVQNTFKEAGVTITDDITLPEKETYTTYASDGKTIVKENVSFDGSVTVDGTAYSYSSVVTYDYTARNASGKLSDTIRQIYVYIQTA